MKFEEYILNRKQKERALREDNYSLGAAIEKIDSLKKQIESGKQQLKQTEFDSENIIEEFKIKLGKTIAPLLVNSSGDEFLGSRLTRIKEALNSFGVK